MHFEPIYKHVHSLHHRSYNPGPWSGLSMHPVEHLFYYGCTVIPTCLLLQVCESLCVCACVRVRTATEIGR